MSFNTKFAGPVRGRQYIFPAVLALLGCWLPATGAQADAGRLAVSVDATPDHRTSRILVGSTEGTDLRPLTDGRTHDRAPAFAPDGKQLAYQSTNELGLDSIVVRSLSDSGSTRVLAVGRQPQWSRDGQRVLFSKQSVNEHNLYVIRADGTQLDVGLKPLTRGQLGRWSPDETQLALVTSAIVEGQDRWQIQILNTASLETRFTLSLPEGYGQVISLDWEPNGQRLLFSVARQEKYQLYILDPKLPEPKRVPVESGTPVAPNPAYGTWSADGSEILFRSLGEPSGSSSRLQIMKADGTAVRTIWEPGAPGLYLHGTAWLRPNLNLAAAVIAKPEAVKTEPGAQAEPAKPEPGKPEPAKPTVPPTPGPQTVTLRVPGPSKKVHAQKLFVIDRQRSPVSVPIASPADENFTISIPVLPAKTWAGRRQGVGITLEMEDGSLYRGTMIFSGAPWATIQGRAKGAKVRLIDGKQLPPTAAGFKQGFKLTLRREGPSLIVAVNEKEILSRPVLASAVKRAYLTLEGFDNGKTYFPLGNIYYQPAAIAQPNP